MPELQQKQLNAYNALKQLTIFVAGLRIAFQLFLLLLDHITGSAKPSYEPYTDLINQLDILATIIMSSFLIIGAIMRKRWLLISWIVYYISYIIISVVLLIVESSQSHSRVPPMYNIYMNNYNMIVFDRSIIMKSVKIAANTVITILSSLIVYIFYDKMNVSARSDEILYRRFIVRPANIPNNKPLTSASTINNIQKPSTSKVNIQSPPPSYNTLQKTFSAPPSTNNNIKYTLLQDIPPYNPHKNIITPAPILKTDV